jgi:hypothetical protein
MVAVSLFLAAATTLTPLAKAALQPGDCSYNKGYQSDSYGGAWCIHVVERTEATFSFPSLYPTNPKFVYVMDDIRGVEITSFPGYSPQFDSQRTGDWQSSLTGFWVEFDKIGTTQNLSSDMATDFRVFYTTKQGTPGGGNGGCDGLLGADCVNQLDATLRRRLTQNGSSVMDAVGDLIFGGGNDTPACPSDMWFTGNSQPGGDRNMGGSLYSRTRKPFAVSHA